MSELVSAQGSATVSPIDAVAARSPVRQIEERYVDAVNPLVEDAANHQSLPILADGLTSALARIVNAYGTTAVAGDVIRHLGGYMCDLAERQRAEREAEEARRSGVAPH
jgi:hypothetical protein